MKSNLFITYSTTISVKNDFGGRTDGICSSEISNIWNGLDVRCPFIIGSYLTFNQSMILSVNSLGRSLKLFASLKLVGSLLCFVFFLDAILQSVRCALKHLVSVFSIYSSFSSVNCSSTFCLVMPLSSVGNDGKWVYALNTFNLLLCETESFKRVW